MGKHAVVILNLGSPKSPEVSDVREYLREFLGDERVIDKHPVVRWLLLNLLILRVRPPRTAAAYRTVWTPEGPPLLAITERLRRAVESAAGVSVYSAMRYAEPSCDAVARRIAADGATDVLVIPQYPQYAMSSYETAEVRMREALREHAPGARVTLVGPFYDDPGYIDALADSARPHLEAAPFDRLLFSFHGVPRRHLTKGDPSHAHCMSQPDCCRVAHPCQAVCYRHQCLRTMDLLVAKLGLSPGRHEPVFQSRLGREEWLRPYTDERLRALPGEGVKRVLVICPAFTADCLETLEEIAEAGKETFLHAGGESYTMIPCLNDHPAYVAWTLGRITRWLAGETRL